MGMFDSLYVPCPDCEAPVEFQSKAGECILARFTLRDVPLKIAIDLEGQTAMCQKCGRVVEIRLNRNPGIQLEVE